MPTTTTTAATAAHSTSARTPHAPHTTTEAITPAEWELMRIIWTVGSTPTRTIIALMRQKRDWSESTIKTLLNRLTKKGFLAVEHDNRKFIYHAAVEESAAMDDSAAQLFDHLCSMKKGKALINLVEHQEMSRTDIKAMIRALQAKLPTAPEKMACDCLPASAREAGFGNAAGCDC